MSGELEVSIDDNGTPQTSRLHAQAQQMMMAERVEDFRGSGKKAFVEGLNETAGSHLCPRL